MKKKLCTVFLTIAFAFSMIPGTIATQIASEQAVQTTWRIEFEDGLSLQSAVSRQNLEAVANDISEVAFTVDAGKECSPWAIILVMRRFPMPLFWKKHQPW